MGGTSSFDSSIDSSIFKTNPLSLPLSEENSLPIPPKIMKRKFLLF